MSLRLSREHGVNSSVARCFYCGEGSEVILFGASYPGGGAAPHDLGVWDMNPCNKCEEHMKKGIILIGVDESTMAKVEEERKAYELKTMNPAPARKRWLPFIPNPHRTGEFIVIADRWVEQYVQPEELKQKILKSRWSFVPTELAQNLLAAQKELEAEEGETPAD